MTDECKSSQETTTSGANAESGLSARQLAALPLLAAGEPYRSVAETIGVAIGTVRNWCSQNETFRKELERLRTLLYEDSKSRLWALSHASTEALYEVLVDRKAPRRDRVAAARVVLGHVHGKSRTHHIRTEQDAGERISQILLELESRHG